ncbi:hypothetical protein TTHERM_00171740 (macronuclear) [Tetrahymena thermophila SB210]|uniref:Uncharacterized protein n=1 Tax=Tetrahymena thermophila (strain SB210) TaxID=312017 RepID=Q22TF1_TETTS|nr:hypothetical protein TTHERM_00171740 [Tetrahymena thermophila SB210]EAR88487.1 hypothetical protein TTHERM_00171740 [Tetrahymena thermophila SB210]|eukprot:XP_001008732.1 hypothetical protein TTHERM_00171740 [Tetrahymena thermophila SB210]
MMRRPSDLILSPNMFCYLFAVKSIQANEKQKSEQNKADFSLFSLKADIYLICKRISVPQAMDLLPDDLILLARILVSS